MDIRKFYIEAKQKEIKVAVSKSLIRYRLLNRYSQKQIAVTLGISQPAYSKMEAGQTKVSSIILQQLAVLYDIGTTDFYTTGTTSEEKISN